MNTEFDRKVDRQVDDALRLVKSISRDKCIGSPFNFDNKFEKGDACHSLKFDNPYYIKAADFTPTKDGQAVLIKTWNYKCEDEVHGYYDVKHARRVYKILFEAGMVPF